MTQEAEFHPIYLSIKDTARYTGLSEYYLRKRLKEGNIHHIMSGAKVLINLPLMLADLESQSTQPARNVNSQ